MFAEILAPTHCPSCSSELVRSNDMFYCRSTECPAQSRKKIEHFAKTLKIKGLGPAAIDKLNLNDFDEIYNLTEEDIALQLNSQKVAAKLYAEIENSRSAPLELVLPALGIPLIGKSATGKLSGIVESFFEINADTCERAGLGPKATSNLLDWIAKEYYGFYDGALPFSMKFSSKSGSIDKVKGVICISGRLKSFKTKAEAETVLKQAGYEVKTSLTKQVTILVNESGNESSKTTQARMSGVTIVTDLKSFLEN